jgi:polysaccharide pyruvyl transferase CsaB
MATRREAANGRMETTRPSTLATTTPRLLLAGFYGVRNLGDELMLRCLVRWMGASFRITVLSERPEESERISGLPAIRNVPLLGQSAWVDAWVRGSAWRLLRELTTFDALAGGGGDVLRDDRGWKHLSFATEKYAVARMSGIPWYILNAGIGPPRTAYGRRMLQFVLQGARLVVVRDRDAYAVAQAMRGPARTYFAGDIVLAMPRLFPDECRADGRPPALREPYVLVCLRGYANMFGRFAMTEARLQRLAAALDTFAQRGLRIAFLPFQQHDTEDDDVIHREVAAKLRHRDAAILVPWTVDVPTIASLFREAALVVAMRLHGAVLAQAFDAPTAILPYDRKLVEFAAQRGVTQIEADALDRDGEAAARLDEVLAGRRMAAADPPPHDWLHNGFPGTEAP